MGFWARVQFWGSVAVTEAALVVLFALVPGVFGESWWTGLVDLAVLPLLVSAPRIQARAFGRR